jgi:DNA anti-recombination protein RmuC
MMSPRDLDRRTNRMCEANRQDRIEDAERELAELEEQLRALQNDNAQKLEQMRHTVDEKLQSTLETRLGQSFTLVSERLEQVQRGLGEMQQLATGVGDLKRVLTNVKNRGSWGEVQLENILEQTLTQEQYARGVKVRPDSGEMVDIAVRLPGRRNDDTPVWLPIDSKVPREDYERLLDAQEQGDAEGVRLHDMTRHMLGLFTGLPGARAWRRTLATKAVVRGAGVEVVREALAMLVSGAPLPHSPSEGLPRAS